MRPMHISASSIAAFKACPARWWGQYVLGIRRMLDTEAQRVGTNWHDLLEVASLKPGSVCPRCAKASQKNLECPLCGGTDLLPDDIMDAVISELDYVYKSLPVSKSIEEAEIERIKLLYSLIGYRWLYSDAEQDEVLCRELKFTLPLINPESGRALPGVKLKGKVDKVVRKADGKLAISEHKSTGSGIAQDSTYWGHLNLDTQITMYLYAVRKMQVDGVLEPYGIKPDEGLINTIDYDVWHKPGISPKKLTQGESKNFVEDGLYCGQEFEVTDNPIRVNGVQAEIEPGKKEGTFTIVETPEMYGARLLQDITDRHEFYFARKELVRTDKEMQRFEWELLHIYRTMQSMIKSGHYFKNEQQCEAKYKCDFIDSCYNGVEFDADSPPDGFKAIFNKETK